MAGRKHEYLRGDVTERNATPLYEAIQKIAVREMGVPFTMPADELLTDYLAELQAMLVRGLDPTLEEIALVLIHG